MLIKCVKVLPFKFKDCFTFVPEGEAVAGPEEGGEAHDGGVGDAEVGTRGLRKCDVTLCHR